MRKNKVLTPILTIAVVTISTIPLSSCIYSKQDIGKVQLSDNVISLGVTVQGSELYKNKDSFFVLSLNSDKAIKDIELAIGNSILNKNDVTIKNNMISIPASKMIDNVITVKTITFEEAEIIKVSSIQITNTEYDIQLGDSIVLNAKVLPENATDKELEWEVESVTGTAHIEIDSETKLVGDSAGIVNVKAKAKDGSGVISSPKEFNFVAPQVSDIELDKETATVEIGEAFTIRATLIYQTNDDEITWTQSSPDGGEVALSKTTSSDEEEITVTGVTKGNVILKASCGEIEKTCAVEVKEKLIPAEIEYTDVDNVNHTCSAKLKTDPDKMAVANIPASTIIDGEEYTVNAIAAGGFSNKNYIQKVVLPNTIVEIKNNGLSLCYDLEEIVLNDGLTKIGEYGCAYTKIKSITLPNSITTLENSAFFSCHELTTVNLNEGLQKIGEYAFSSCKKLDGIVLPSTLTDLGSYAFAFCESLKTFTFTKSSVVSIPDSCFEQAPLSNGLTIPDNITSIGYYAFGGCSYDELIIDSATIRDFNDIDSYLFNSPTKVYVKGSTAPSVDSTLTKKFDSATSDKPDYLKYVAKPFMYELTGNDTYKVSKGNPTGDITIPSTYNSKPVDTIGSFLNANITSVTIPDSIKTFNGSGFSGCKKLTSVIFTGTTQLTKFNGSYFNSCPKLSSFDIPEGIAEIGMVCFGSCIDKEADTGLSSVTFPSTIQKIEYGAFNQDEKLTADGLTFNTTGTFKIYKKIDLWSSEESIETESFDPTTDKDQALKYLLGDFTDPDNPVYYKWEKNS